MLTATVAHTPSCCCALRNVGVEWQSSVLLFVLQDGTRFINQFNISPLREVDGELAYFIGVQMQVEGTRTLWVTTASCHRDGMALFWT